MKTIETKKTASLKIKTSVKAGGFGTPQHNRKTIGKERAASLKIKSAVKAGGFGTPQHNRKLAPSSSRSKARLAVG